MSITSRGVGCGRLSRISVSHRPGKTIDVRMPYGDYRYVVYAKRIVDDRNWSILRPRAFEKLVLTACHPLYSADQRYAVFARLQA